MKKLGIIALWLSLASVGSACDKPSEGDCRKAIDKIRTLTGTAKMEGATNVDAAIRACRGNGSKKSVQCAMDASSLEQLERCGLISADEMNDLEGKSTETDTPAPK
jgi:hypothetical protein